MRSVLVVYGSWSGATAGVAQRLGSALTKHGVEVKVAPASSAPDPKDYDCVVVGSAIKSGLWHPQARDWVRGNARVLKDKPAAFFSVCLTPVVHPMRIADAHGYIVPVAANTGIQPVDATVFAGAYDPEMHSFMERIRARLWGAKPGDFRDWMAIDRWAGSLVREFGF